MNTTVSQSDLLAMRLSRPATAARRPPLRRRLRDWRYAHPRASKALGALATAAEAVALGILGYAWFVIMLAM